MLHILKVRIPIEAGNTALRDPDFGKKMKALLAEIKAQAAYFTTVDGQRGGYIVVDIKNASEIPAIAEPFFLWLNADVTAMPAMTPEDLGKAGPAIGAAVKKWG
ncbi:MAG: hypothetical protein ABIZ49_06300 [Opitutaceae bacterium]